MIDFLQSAWDAMGNLVPLLTVLAIVVIVLWAVNAYLRRRWQNSPDLQFRFQLIMLALSLAGLIALLIVLPVNDTLRGQLLSLLGILLSAAIALASTTFIGNILASVMLRLIQKARPGDFIEIDGISGRITEMGLLHTELQLEDRDLMTIPNLLMVTKPLRRVRASGTIVSSEVSLGYDVPRGKIVSALREAGESAGLSECFVQVRELGDFSVTYRIAGLLSDTSRLISARSELREAMLDALHGAGIEIVSPTFMNTLPRTPGEPAIPRVAPVEAEPERTRAEEVAFDKADEAASLTQLKDTMAKLDTSIEEAEGERKETLEAERDALKQRIDAAHEEHKHGSD